MLITQRPIVKAMSEGGAYQPGFTQDNQSSNLPPMPATKKRGGGVIGRNGPHVGKGLTEGRWVGCDEFCVTYLPAPARHTKPPS